MAGVNFGSKGASAVRMIVRSEVPARIEIVPDDTDGMPAAVLDIPACEGDKEIRTELPTPLTGTHDLYFRFTESGTSLIEWQFK